MSHADVPEQELRDKRRRSWVIVGISAVAFLATSAVALIGNRQVNNTIDDIRRAATTANVDPASIANYAFGTEPDPVAEALGVDTLDVVSLQQQSDNRWCAEVEASALVSSDSVFFVIDLDGRFSEAASCRI